MAFSPSDHQLIVAQNQQGLHFIDVGSRLQVGSLALGPANIFAVQPVTQSRVAVGDEAGYVIIIEVSSRQIAMDRRVSNKAIRAIALLPSGLLAAAGSDGNVHLLEAETLAEISQWAAHSPTVMALCTLPNGCLATGGRDARIRIWDLTSASPTLKQEVAAHHYTIYDLALHPGGDLLLSASMDKTLKLWDLETMRLLRVQDHARYGGHTASVNRCLWLNSQHALSCSDDRTAILWELGQA
jgi:WD40 repeat protein